MSETLIFIMSIILIIFAILIMAVIDISSAIINLRKNSTIANEKNDLEDNFLLIKGLY